MGENDRQGSRGSYYGNSYAGGAGSNYSTGNEQSPYGNTYGEDTMVLGQGAGAQQQYAPQYGEDTMVLGQGAGAQQQYAPQYGEDTMVLGQGAGAQQQYNPQYGGQNTYGGQNYGYGNQPQGGQPYGYGNQPQGGQPYGYDNQPQGGQAYGYGNQPQGGQPYGYGNTSQNGQNYGGQPPYGPGGTSQWDMPEDGQPKKPKKKGKKIGLIIGIAAAVVVIAILAIIFIPKLLEDDKSKVFKALSAVGADMAKPDEASVISMISSEAMEKKFSEDSVSMKLELELSEVPSALTEDMMALEGAQVDVEMDVDMVNKLYSGNIAVGYLDTDLVSLGIYGSETELCVAVPQLFAGYLRVPAEDFVSEYNKSVLGMEEPMDESLNFSLNFFEYVEENPEMLRMATQLGLDINALYEAITVEKVDNSKEFNLDGKTSVPKKYKMTLPRDSYYAILENLLDNLADNTELLESAGMTAADISEIRYEMDRVFTEDIYIYVYMVGKNVAGIELETALNADGEMIDVLGNIVFENSEAYGSNYDGALTMGSIYDEISMDFYKDTTVSGSKTISEMGLSMEVDYEMVNIEYTCSYDPKSGDYSYEIYASDDYDSLEIGLNGYVNSIVADTSYDLGIDELYLYFDGEKISLSGNIAAGPVSGTIQAPDGPAYDLFKMSEEELYEWYTEVEDNLYSLMSSMY